MISYLDMALKCELCFKGIMVGKQHRHHGGVAGGRWLRRAPKTQKVFKPNLHKTRVLVDGMYKRMKLCTKCLRLLKKAAKETSSIAEVAGSA